METPSRHSYDLDGATRVFPIASPIKGDNYCRVEVDGVYITDRSKYDIVNNSIVFVNLADVPNGSQLDVLVVQSEEAIGLLGTTTNVDTVATNIDDVNTVANNIASVNTVAGNDANVSTVAGISGNVTTVAGIAANVTTVAGVASSVPTVAAIDADVSAVAAIAADVTVAADNVTDITNFADVYYGPSATAPTTRRDGSALVQGDLWFDTLNGYMRVWNGSSWLQASVQGASREVITATEGQTAILVSSGYNVDQIDVYLNGQKMITGSDFTAIDGQYVTFLYGLQAGDKVEVISMASIATDEANLIQRVTFTADGATATFDTTHTLVSKSSIMVSVNGVVQNATAFSVSGTTFTMNETPEDGDVLDVMVFGVSPTSIIQQAESIIYTPVGETSTNVQARLEAIDAKLADTVSVKDFGAVGDGVTDDTVAIQAALDYAFQDLNSDQYNPATGPTRSVGQLKVVIPNGKYLISSPLLVYGGTRLIGEGISSTVLISSTTMSTMISLVGNNYNGTPASHNTEISQLSLNGSYTVDFGITNAVTQDVIGNSVFKDLFISRTKEVGLYIVGCWASLFENIQVLNSNIGIIFGRNSAGNGFNLNTVLRCDAQSCNRMGMYLDVQTCNIINPNIDKIGTSWLPNPSFDVTKTFSYGGTDYTQFNSVEIDHPIGIYVTGITKDTVIDAPWFEFVYTSGGTGVAIEVNGDEAYGNGVPIMQGIDINRLHIGASVDTAYNIQWSQVKLTSPFITNATTKLTLGSSNYARVVLDSWYYSDILNLATADTTNRVKAINTVGYSDSGIIDEYYSANAQSGIVHLERFHDYDGTTYLNDMRTVWDATGHRINKELTHYTGGYTTSKKSISFKGDVDGLGMVSLPQNIGAFSVNTSSTGLTKTVSFKMNTTTRDVSARSVILLMPTNNIASVLINGGYHIQNITATSFDVVFTVVNGNTAYFNFVVIDNDGYAGQ